MRDEDHQEASAPEVALNNGVDQQEALPEPCNIRKDGIPEIDRFRSPYFRTKLLIPQTMKDVKFSGTPITLDPQTEDSTNLVLTEELCLPAAPLVPLGPSLMPAYMGSTDPIQQMAFGSPFVGGAWAGMSAHFPNHPEQMVPCFYGTSSC